MRLLVGGFLFLFWGAALVLAFAAPEPKTAWLAFSALGGLALVWVTGPVPAAACLAGSLIGAAVLVGIDRIPLMGGLGIGTAFPAAGLLVWVRWNDFRLHLNDAQRRVSHFRNMRGTLRTREQELRSSILVEEESIQEIGRLFGISKRFLATLNLDESMEIAEEVLAKEFPRLDALERHRQIQRFREAVESDQLSVKALADPMPAGIGEAHGRDRWWIVCGQLALGLQRVSRYRQVQESATQDGLTGLMTRRYFRQRLAEEVGRALRRKTQLAFLMIDLDHFKQVNDTFGHLVGDVVLRDAARMIQESVREIDLVARYGGEEFAVALPEIDHAFAVRVANRIRETIEKNPIRAYDEKVVVTVSVGVALCPGSAETRDDLIEAADQAMYQAKSRGRNQTVSA